MTMNNHAYVIAFSLVASTALLSVPASARTSTVQVNPYAATQNFNAGYEASLRRNGNGISSRSYNRGYSDGVYGLGYHPRGSAWNWQARNNAFYVNSVDIHSDPANM
jgi:hypothetical protein